MPNSPEPWGLKIKMKCLNLYFLKKASSEVMTSGASQLFAQEALYVD